MGLGQYEWNELLKAIEGKKCTPFVGAGASAQWIPLKEISTRWAEEFKYPLEESDDISKVSQYLAIVRASELFPKKKLSEELSIINPPDFREEALRNTSHAVLADLNLPVYITTNYDLFLEAALRSRGRNPISEFCRWNEGLKRYVQSVDISSIFDRRVVPKISVSEPLVYHLHGNVDIPQSIALTERDYIDFVININREEELPAIIRKALSDTTLLFIGYGLEDINFRVIFQGVIDTQPYTLRESSIAVQLPSGFTEEKKQQAQEYLDNYTKKKFNIAVYWGNALDFAAELRKRLDDFRSKK